ncbi:MAG: glycosyltransferase [Bacteroidota bacterium]
MKLSIIIVNYNVKHFLEQCLISVREACKNIPSEVFVVDNNSVDGSAELVKSKFPEVIFIRNEQNLGFAKANNLAIHKASGEYMLLLNPDTIVESDTFSKVITFMDSHADAGGLGVRMLDGKGKFLPESKRGLPTPSVAFYKIFGLSKLFPRSKRFGKYHLTYLDPSQTHVVDVLSGAFMLLRKSVVDVTGPLDEDFFMYGEDIDLSYRITKAGFKNYYFPETRIIHYKGESTKKSSINYVFVFYNAMLIFARKHFSKKNAKLLSFLIHLAIFLRASMAIFSQFVKRAFVPFFDAALIYAGIFLIKLYWENYIKLSAENYYPAEYIYYIIPSYVLIWLSSVFLSGGYDKPLKLFSLFRGILFGTIFILIVYALLPESFRFSRAIILLGSAWVLLSMTLFRSVLALLGFKNYRFDSSRNKRFAIIGSIEEVKRVHGLLSQTGFASPFIAAISPTDEKNDNPEFIGTFNQIPDIIQIYEIDEIIFCAKDIQQQKIIDMMTVISNPNVDFKIAPPESMFIIGSNSIHSSGELYVIDINAISRSSNKRSKRLLDIIFSMILLVFLPVFLIISKKPFGLLRNFILVSLGFRTWVGYSQTDKEISSHLPKIRIGILYPSDALPNKKLDQETLTRLDILYAKDYKTTHDLNILLKGIRNLGR